MSLPRIDKDAFVTETNVMFTKFGDYLLTVESNLEQLKRSGLQQIVVSFGTAGRLKSKEAKRFFNSQRKKFERDMARFCRYSAITKLYSLFEVRCRAFAFDFCQTHAAKVPLPEFAQRKANKNVGFVRVFRAWLECTPAAVTVSEPRIWNQLQDFQLIRNCITHAHGEKMLLQPSQRARIEEAVRRTRRIRFDAAGALTVDAGFPFAVCDRLHHFFGRVFRAAGYGMWLPPGYVERMQKQFEGFEQEIANGIAEYNLRQRANLGGTI